MIVRKINFPAILSENEQTYFRYLEGIVSSVDMDAQIMATKRIEGISVRITPSSLQVFPLILQQVKKFHTMLGLHLDFSKSMKTGSNIFFNINFR